MRKKPLLVEIIAIILCIVPAIVLGRVIAYMDVRNQEIPLGYLLQIGGLAVLSYGVGYGVWKVRLWGYYGILSIAVVTIIVDFWSLLNSETTLAQVNRWIYFDVICAAMAIFLIVQKGIRRPYLDPKIRWWETAERFIGDVAGVFKINNSRIESPILDISATGCFVDFDTPIEVGTSVEVEINFNSIKFSSAAVLVRRSLSPVGLGLKFTGVSAKSKKAMKNIISQLTKKR
jgi:hypothetical protein